MPRRLLAIAVICALLQLVSCGEDSARDDRTSQKNPAASASSATTAPKQTAVRAVIPPCPDRPNILIVSLDTLRFDATSLDPKGRNATKYLRQLADVGVNFTRAYSTHDSTPPSHFSMLTGLVNGYQSEIDVPEISVAHQLEKLGYRTFGVSANGNLAPEFTRSLQPFDSFVNLMDVWQALPEDRKAGMLPAIDARLDAYKHEKNDWNRMMVFSSASMVMRHLEPQLRRRQPFFGFVNLLEAHDPYVPSPKVYNRTREEPGLDIPDLRYRTLSPELTEPASIEDETRRAEITAALQKASGRAWSLTYDLDAKTVGAYRRRYHARVRELDAAVGVLLQTLRERKLLDSTILIVTSDHGEAFGEEDLITHSFMNAGDREATNRVPLLMVFPPCYRYPARTIQELATIADIPLTIYDLLGIDPHPIWKRTHPGNVGRSLLPHITGSSRSATRSADTGRGAAADPAARARQDREALERLRALGYLQ